VWYRIEEAGDVVIVKVFPRVDPENANVQRIARVLVGVRSAPKIVVNLSLLETASSTFVNDLVRLQETVQAANGRLVLCGLQPVVRAVFRVTNLERHFDFFDDEESAVEEVSHGPIQ